MANQQVYPGATGTPYGVAIIAEGSDEVQLVAPAGNVLTVEQAQTSSGLTTATTPYTSGDQLGTLLTFTTMTRISGGRGVIEGAVLTDDSAVIGPVDLLLFRSTVTVATDNAANSFSDADMQVCVGVINMPAPATSALNSVSSWDGAKSYGCAATSLFVAMVTRSGNAVFAGGATSLRLRLFVRQE